MEQKAGPAELPGASAPAFAHGAGQQNGYLGYGLNTLTGRSVGFLPPFLQDATALAPVDPYNAFFQPLAIKSKSNVNLWNVRASQKTSPNPNGSGYTYFAMQSEKVNPRFGILAVEGDPLTTNPAGVMPNVVTSLDRKFDSAWDNLLKQATVPVGLFGFPGTNNNPLLVPVNGVGGHTRNWAGGTHFTSLRLAQARTPAQSCPYRTCQRRLCPRQT